MGSWIQILNNFGIIKVGWKYVWNELTQNGVQTYFILNFWYIVILGPNTLLKPTPASLVFCLMIAYFKIFSKYHKDILFVSLTKSLKNIFESQRCCIILSYIKFDLNNVPKIFHFKSIKESFMSFSSVKNICYVLLNCFLGHSIFIRFVSNKFKCFHNVLKTLLYTFTK
jgi:hypothetical protein